MLGKSKQVGYFVKRG